MHTKTLKLKKVAEHIGVPLRTLYRMIDDDRFPVDPIAGTKPRLWNTADVDAWIAGDDKCKT
jgi:predicted DNA-binding transcriptional regulator AlpA